MDKHTARERDLAWLESQARHETLALARSSHIIVASHEIREMWLNLQSDECLVLSADGSIHKGNQSHVRKNKMTKSKDRYATERHSDLLQVASDLKAAQEMYPMHITGYRRAGNWDTRVRLASGSGSTGNRKGRKSEPVLPADEI